MIKNSINSTDGRNGRNLVKLSKRKYIEQYGTVKNNEAVIEEVKNKRGQTYYSANRMVVTCTIRSIQDQLSQQGIVVSYGKIISLRPFFITFATEKEIALCLCELCLNTRMLFEPLIAQAKRDNVSLASAKNVKNKNPMSPTCQMSQEITKVNQFELTQKPYTKINKDGKVVEKISKKTE